MQPPRDPGRVAAITGMGLKTPAGCDLDSFWARVCTGVSTADHIKAWDASADPVNFGCEITDFDVADYLDPREARRLDRVSHLGWAAAADAIADAGPLPYSPARSAVVAATGIGGYRTAGEQHVLALEKGLARVSPFLIPMVMPNMTAGLISVNLGWQGPSLCVSTACASGANAIGEGLRMLRDGSADVVIAGGADALVDRYVLAGFYRAGALSRRGKTDPAGASRPFDVGRDGFVMGEGAGFVILERWEDAVDRGARIHGLLTGYGRNSDAHHVTEPSPGGAGAVSCMELALGDAGIEPEAVVHVNAHGTSTPFNDRTEGEALGKVFGRSKVPVTATKGMIGHLIGASGAVELVTAVLTNTHGRIPPIANLEQLDPEIEVDAVAGAPREFVPGPIVSNSFGFGGHNAVLVVEPAPVA